MDHEKKLSITKFLIKKPKQDQVHYSFARSSIKELPSLENMHGMSWINESQNQIQHNQIQQNQINKPWINETKRPLTGYAQALQNKLNTSTSAVGTMYNPPIPTNISKTEAITKSKTEKRCYTCKPRGHILLHIISESACSNFLFHHDLNNRPIILVTPKMHVKTIEELPEQLRLKLLESISQFCKKWNIQDYETSWNNGSWQQRDHFHIKIKTSEKYIKNMRNSHFETKLKNKK